mmetsp:Transcript_11706/g.27886  ORF Transcript_11706/g.27886 Transcript_11706/m.27886 type:complete len:348 (+) Transcript_11706:358-1401(+)
MFHPWRSAWGHCRGERCLGVVDDLSVHVAERGLRTQKKRRRLTARRRPRRNSLCGCSLVWVGLLDGQANEVAEPLQRPLPRDGHGRRYKRSGDLKGGKGSRFPHLFVRERVNGKLFEVDAGDTGRQRQRGGGRRCRRRGVRVGRASGHFGLLLQLLLRHCRGVDRRHGTRALLHRRRGILHHWRCLTLALLSADALLRGTHPREFVRCLLVDEVAPAPVRAGAVHVIVSAELTLPVLVRVDASRHAQLLLAVREAALVVVATLPELDPVVAQLRLVRVVWVVISLRMAPRGTALCTVPRRGSGGRSAFAGVTSSSSSRGALVGPHAAPKSPTRPPRPVGSTLAGHAR